jgi:hypothetical protein
MAVVHVFMFTLQDIVAGLPEEMLNRYSGYVYFPFMVSAQYKLALL